MKGRELEKQGTDKRWDEKKKQKTKTKQNIKKHGDARGWGGGRLRYDISKFDVSMYTSNTRIVGSKRPERQLKNQNKLMTDTYRYFLSNNDRLEQKENR